MNIIINVKWDNEASVYIAICQSESYDDLIQRVKDAVPELLELNHIQGCTSMCFLTSERRVACA